jgi:hypothetical protein
MTALTDQLRKEYFEKASKKLDDDFVKVINYIKSKDLDVILERPSNETQGYHTYAVAKKMWEADGYIDLPNIVESKPCTKDLISIVQDKTIKEINNDHDTMFLSYIRNRPQRSPPEPFFGDLVWD